MRRFFARLTSLFRRRSEERELAREIEAHLALLREDFERRGLSQEEAALAARRAYGGVEQAKELHREARSFVWIEHLFKDVRYGWGNLLRNPGFTLVAVIALALGIGVNATFFGIYNAVALKQLPLADPSRVVRVKRWFGHNEYAYRYNFAYPEYVYLRDHSSAFSGLTAASSAISVLASTATTPEHLNGYAVSANYFADLGVHAIIGRTFLPDEDRLPGANTVVVLSFRFWQRRYNGDRSVIGRTIKLNGLAYTIVGVAPRDFTGTDAVIPTESSFWAPLSVIDQLDPAFGPASDPASNGTWRDRWRDSTHPGFQLLARLKKDVEPAKAQAETDLLIHQYLSGYRETQPTTAITLQRTSYFGSAGDFWLHAFAAAVLAIVSLVLLVACANVANMLLARGVARQREVAIRLALGASRGRIIRQLLTESILLSLLGGAAGVVLSAWAGRLLWMSLITIAPAFRQFRGELDVSLDAHVFVYGLALSVFTGIFFGLAPALQSTRVDLVAAINQGGSPLGGTLGRSRLRGLLLGGQVTVSVLLLVVSGGLMSGLVSSFVKAADLGFETHDAYLVLASYGNDPAKAIATKRRLRDRLETLPELRSVATGWAPLQGSLQVPMAAGKWHGEPSVSFASDAYFETFRIRLREGRSFTRQEADRGAPVAVISESTARQVWPNADPLGKRFSVELLDKVTDYEVVGVAKDVRFVMITQLDPLHVYLPTNTLLGPGRLSGNLLFSIRGDRDKVLEKVQSAAASVDPNLLPSLDLVSLEEGPVALQRGFFRVLAAFAGILTLLSLTLAGVGIYGVMAFLVSQRTREIGIRVALGATSRSVIKSVVIQGLRPVFMGTLVGLVGSAWISKLALAPETTRVVGLYSRTFSYPALCGELALVFAIALFASIVPAGRALRVAPMVTLRHE
jgi:macrolide transport system ATP-binding/permease protein